MRTRYKSSNCRCCRAVSDLKQQWVHSLECYEDILTTLTNAKKEIASVPLLYQKNVKKVDGVCVSAIGKLED